MLGNKNLSNEDIFGSNEPTFNNTYSAGFAAGAGRAAVRTRSKNKKIIKKDFNQINMSYVTPYPIVSPYNLPTMYVSSPEHIKTIETINSKQEREAKNRMYILK